jgi:hypothetical protein
MKAEHLIDLRRPTIFEAGFKEMAVREKKLLIL